MSEAQAIEIEFEARGETLVVRDLEEHTSGISAPRMNEICIKSGTRAVLATIAPQDDPERRTVSLFAGHEKIGILNWDGSGGSDRSPVDWTPLSKKYKTAICGIGKNSTNAYPLRLRITRCQTMPRRSGRSGTAAGHLGFAGL